jgi:CelD/BcsL family acetyltransferase involved in cellulose biosynthesis
LIVNPPGPITLETRERTQAHLSEISTEVVDTLEGVRALKADYEHLHELTGNTLPFALHEWHLSWCEHFLNHDPHIQEYPLFHVLRRKSGECVAIVPLIMSRRRFGPLKFASIALVGSDPGLTEIRSPLVSPGYEWLTVHAVHEQLSHLRDWDCVQWSGMNAEMAEALEGASAPKWREVSCDYVLDLAPSWEKFRARLRRNVRESLRHCYNSLKREGKAFEFVVARTPSEIRVALDRFLGLHAMRANMVAGTRHPNFFASRPLQAFLYEICDRLALRDAARVFQLRIGDEIVASRIAFVLRDSLYLYYSGFDPAWSRFSVMTTTFAEALKYAIANGLKTVNLSLGAEQSKLRWSPRLVEFHSALVHQQFLRSRILSSAYRLSHCQHCVPVRFLKNFLHMRRWN